VGSRGSLPFTPRLTMVKEASLLGMTLWNTRPAEWDACTAGVAAGLDAGFLRPVVGREFPLAEAPRAHVEILAPGACGKMVLVV
jgi:NADPH2:quinone reductase